MNLTDLIKQRKKKETLKDKLSSWLSYNKTYKIEIPYYNFKKGISNIIKWAKVIWKDTDYGYHDIMKIWQFKLDKMADDFDRKYQKANKHGNCYYNDLPEKAKYMRIASRLINKLYGEGEFYDNTYEEEWSKYHKKEYIWRPADGNSSLEEVKKLAQSINRDRKIDSILEDDFEYDEIDLEGDIELDIFDLEPDKPYTIHSKVLDDNFDEYFALNKLSYKKAQKQTGSKDRELLAQTISEIKHKKAKKLFFKIIEEKLETWID
jgi:hypothetical protein